MSDIQCTTHHNACDCREADFAAERARADSLTASIVKACEGTGCLNAHELAEALKAARRLIADHCQDEEKVRAILKEFDRSDSHGSDGPIELAERAAEALKAARADRDRATRLLNSISLVSCRDDRQMCYMITDAALELLGSNYRTDVKVLLSRANGGG